MGWILIIFPFLFILMVCCCFIWVYNTPDDGDNYAMDVDRHISAEEPPDMLEEQEQRF